ncbi:Tetratricopeptide repeat-containing protein [Tistlia consotensis]|uniref:Tetratricopeptide repeat-containing protein n=1 Tax=Tistlia consotensis USBA 355 TaxID=560819 RepID=A0A1Y6CBE7_9PROT|nr:tetratricopeptide repeat protein [Tistlia consotensis]SMF44184.1 Tetratricopeptide repeat-containing protein [Tistlia consotensis USBA 355]SNR43143.1 Tetratricopeptide repeat-containing protein [Tistlia consotensis]
MDFSQRVQQAAAKHQAGRLDEAAADYRAILALQPGQPDALHLLGLVAQAKGQVGQAIDLIGKAVEAAPGQALYRNNLGAILLGQGRAAEALAQFRRVLELNPDYAEAWVNLGEAQLATGDPAAAQGSLREGLRRNPSLAAGHAGLARACAALGRGDEGFRAAARAISLQPLVPGFEAIADEFAERRRYSWHFQMMNDAARNAAFRAAIERSVRPGMTVLEIGTGSGLLAMMAARAGAARVVTCERRPEIAAVARRIVEANGLADRVTVVEAASTALQLGQALAAPADLLIAEIYDSHLLAEDALLSLADAKARLLKPGAPILPGRILLRGRPIESEELAGYGRVGTVEGFDLSPFDALANARFLAADAREAPWRALGAPLPLLDFELSRFLSLTGSERIDWTPTASGRLDGFLLWFELDLGEGLVVSNGPESDSRSWAQGLQLLPRPPYVEAGRPAALQVEWLRRFVFLDPLDEPPAG